MIGTEATTSEFRINNFSSIGRASVVYKEHGLHRP